MASTSGASSSGAERGGGRKRGRPSSGRAPPPSRIEYVEPEPLADIAEDIEAEEAAREERAEGDAEAVPRQPDIREHTLLAFAPGTDEHVRLQRMLGRTVLQPRTIDWELLGTLGERPWFEDILEPRWRGVLAARGPQYTVLTMEFASTVRFTLSTHIEFALGRRLYRLSIEDFAVRLGLYTAEEVTQPIFTESIRGITSEPIPRGVTGAQLGEFWLTIGDGVFHPSCRASQIRDPRIRFLHRIIVCTLGARYMGLEKVTQFDLFILYCLIGRRPANLAMILISSLVRVQGRGRGSRLVMGTYIGQLAESLGIFEDYPRETLHPGPTAQHYSFLDMQQMGVCPLDLPARFGLVRPLIPVPVPEHIAPDEVPVIGAIQPPQPRHGGRPVQVPVPPPPPPPPATLETLLAGQERIEGELALQRAGHARLEAAQVRLEGMMRLILDHLGIPQPPPQ